LRTTFENCSSEIPKVFRNGRDAEERAKEGIALHAELQLGLGGGFAGDVEARQDEDADVVFLNELAVLRRDALPGHLGRVA
jgi:hypothetical protein